MTAAGGVLATSVTLRDSKFQLVTFAAGSTPPAWAQALITNPKAWAPTSEDEVFSPEDEVFSPKDDFSEELAPTQEPQTPEETEAPASDKPSLPPKRGAGSGRDAWVDYANAWGVQFPEGANRDYIIAAVEAAPEVPSE